jgi:hypothetical protein
MKGNKATVAILKHAETDLKNIHCAYRLGQATKDELYQARLRYHGLRRAWKCGILGAVIFSQKEMMFEKHIYS